MASPPLPVLYSFRRCPYAIRARLALCVSGTLVELREVDLKRKPAALLALSSALAPGHALAQATDGFSGAEIEQAVVSALYAAHADGLPVDEARLLSEVKATRPLSVLMAEQVNALRDWARSRTVPAD